MWRRFERVWRQSSGQETNAAYDVIGYFYMLDSAEELTKWH